jgi:hypothetical protein
MQKNSDERLNYTLTVCQVRVILNKYQVPFNEHALNAMLRTAKKPRIKIALIKCWKCVKFVTWLLCDSIKKVVYKPKYSKGGIRHGRKDM